MQHARGARLHQAARQLLPHALGHQMGGFACLHHAAQQGLRFRSNGKGVKARGKARQAQDAHGVFTEGIGHVPQHARAQVAQAAKGVDECGLIACPVRGGGNGVDGQVAPRQVFFQRDGGAGLHGKAPVAGGAFALGARQGVFLARLRMKENGKVLAHGHKAARGHVFRRGAHHHPVAVVHGQAQQTVAHGATDHVGSQGGQGRGGSSHEAGFRTARTRQKASKTEANFIDRKISPAQYSLGLYAIDKGAKKPARPLPCSFSPLAAALYAARSNTATLSTWAVWGNMFTTPAARQR